MKHLTLSFFDFNLPQQLIAQNPLADKEEAKLLIVNQNIIADKQIKDLVDLISPLDLLIFNNTKVIPARLIAKKGEVTIELTLHHQINHDKWLAFAKKSKRINPGDILQIAEDFYGTIVEKLEGGEVKIYFHDAQGKIIAKENFYNNLEKYGYLPLPPYIKRQNINTEADKTNYQSIFAAIEGAVASPTASLHFTSSLMQRIKEKGINTAFVTLHVGAGTFLPVKNEDISQHKIHKEYGELSQDTVNAIINTKNKGGNVIAVGTTAMRVLEYSAQSSNGNEPFLIRSLKEFKGEIDLFILPGFEFKVVDALITNFHLPKSTLFMLTCAFCGLNTMQKAYKHAIQKQYRFFSYGDCCFLNKT
ncbi:S-adenosylmethionine:tRNA ribosyltransferase-isomerase [Candidatus Hepatincolaceae symbiont of Richtersius coronifer]